MLLLYVYYMSLVIRLSFYFIPHRRSVRYYRSFGSKERKNLVSHLFLSLSLSHSYFFFFFISFFLVRLMILIFPFFVFFFLVLLFILSFASSFVATIYYFSIDFCWPLHLPRHSAGLGCCHAIPLAFVHPPISSPISLHFCTIRSENGPSPIIFLFPSTTHQTLGLIHFFFL